MSPPPLQTVRATFIAYGFPCNIVSFNIYRDRHIYQHEPCCDSLCIAEHVFWVDAANTLSLFIYGLIRHTVVILRDKIPQTPYLC